MIVVVHTSSMKQSVKIMDSVHSHSHSLRSSHQKELKNSWDLTKYGQSWTHFLFTIQALAAKTLTGQTLAVFLPVWPIIFGFISSWHKCMTPRCSCFLQSLFWTVSVADDSCLLCFTCQQCHGLWDNKEVEMPDFFKKLKKKNEKNKINAGGGGGGRGGEDAPAPRRRLPFLPMQASTTSSLFHRWGKGNSSEQQGVSSVSAVLAGVCVFNSQQPL